MSTSAGGRGGGVLGRVRRASLWCLHEWRSARFGQLPVRANASLILFAPSCHVARCAFSSKRVCVCARGRSCTGRPLFFLCRRECVPHLVGFASDGRKKNARGASCGSAIATAAAPKPDPRACPRVAAFGTANSSAWALLLFFSRSCRVALLPWRYQAV